MDKDAYVNTKITATVLKGDKVLLSRDGDRHSLMGGFVNYDLGFPRCLVARIYNDHYINVKSQYINGIYQYFDGNNWVTNINVVARLVDGGSNNGMVKFDEFDIGDVVAGKIPYRTPDTILALIDLNNPLRAPLNRVHCPYDSSGGAGVPFFMLTESHPETVKVNDYECTVMGSVVKSGDEFLLMECNREEFRGKYSLLGGKLNPGESILFGAKREFTQESATKVFFQGVVGIYINQVSRNHYITNFSLYGEVQKDSIELDVSKDREEEVKSLLWVNLEKLESMKGSLRTKDAYHAIQDSQFHKSPYSDNLIPLELIKRIDANTFE